MKDAYRLTAERYLSPTPAGAYYAASGNGNDPIRRFLFSLMQGVEGRLITEQLLSQLTGLKAQESLELLHRVHELGWVQGETVPRRPPEGTLEVVLPDMLSMLSCSGKALLADQQGFYLATHGFSHETAEELSAMSADLASLYQRHQGLLENNLGVDSAACALVNASGDSKLGFWPLLIGDQRFALVLAGLPAMNQPAFTNLVWCLSKRYMQNDQ